MQLSPFNPSSVQFSRSVVSDSLRRHESQHARPPCPSPTPGVHSDSCPSSQWCRPTISSSVVPFSSCPQSLPASESFPMSQLFAWGGQSTGVSVQWTLKNLQYHSSKASILWRSAFFTVQLSHPYMTTGKTIALTRQTFVGKVMSLLFNMLSRLVITFLPRSKRLLISWLQSPSALSESFKFDSSNIFSFEDMRALLTLVRAEVRRILNCVRYNIILHRIHLKKNL